MKKIILNWGIVFLCFNIIFTLNYVATGMQSSKMVVLVLVLNTIWIASSICSKNKSFRYTQHLEGSVTNLCVSLTRGTSHEDEARDLAERVKESCK